MQLDAFTLVAQVVNFLILVVVLRALLYGPVLRALQAREQGMQQRLSEVEALQAQALADREHWETVRRELEESLSRLQREATEQVEAERLDLLEKAREEVSRLELRWYRELGHRAERMVEELRELLSRSLVAAVRRVLEDLSGERLEERIARRLLERLSEEDLQVLQEDPVAASGSELSPEVREELDSRLPGVRFEVSPELAPGLELRGGGRAVAWHLSAYLEELEKSWRQDLMEATGGSRPA